ncbi:Fpg/Nei family DNA glycosylase [Hoyosella rhizosphaerae]|uniref:DNA-(apurinic or apyrimidinic site) lyase n=1 Tax=Hoyosella rhizosphaerae TaxID=1755582 RepID=A0A916UC31_9ACTN|nr:Fpg/Nei family DNA glycosylase [Hoyosella rhizosphaerae]MBN4925756.1 Fpg/Nei family DNA glycosylase [Hoyosella rhizosphaerae]GGC68208.1 endonuclease VIII [Hoyosella rhizosphaerae]
MPEGDTVFRTATALRAALEGEVLTRCEFRVPRYATVNFSGSRVDRVWPYGKHLFIQVGDHVIHSHLKMEGTWHTYPKQARWRKPAWQARVVLENDAWQAIGFSLGFVRIIPFAGVDAVTDKLGPDILGPDWDAAEAVRRMSEAADVPIGVALLDQSILAGVGNVYRSEVCFLRGIDPVTPVRSVNVSSVVDLAARMLVANKNRSMRCTTGNLRAGQQLWVYGRDRKPCRRCGTVVERRIIGAKGYESSTVPNADDRLVFVCPQCQVCNITAAR